MEAARHDDCRRRGNRGPHDPDPCSQLVGDVAVAKEEIEIEIGPDGKVKARTIGIKGPRCLDVAELLARIVGREESRELTSEYYETEVQQERRIDVRQGR
ncbi:MAG TPA: DUF2997 domain-containing protein [Planctomycetaceae bacterium]|nr:DUF2997 domain-containing protein [Planctomycetaceae bacterium]